ncbi:T9SS type A sorting domain-containing protein [Formosa sp. PL04]|uniref:galactose-binding domain-containing protein n=1 Tax=Formosa sp. PL04 TaxID=3081755 RepID=UPI002980C889|nr:T9SS type A sorting domain-containing protein [Formosa sp. PL04]MDW5290818.1 T9SS type A sorting domain-containing protein [Formosa sp. PL04]
MFKKQILITIIAIILIGPYKTLAQANLLDIMPNTAVDKSFYTHVPKVDYGNLFQQSGTTSFTTAYSPSNSYWIDPTAADEEHVYLAKLQHSAATAANSWELRIGKGGQMYSFKSAYGEGIPPQSIVRSTWMDEVWQPVCANTTLSNRDFSSGFYFVHGAGAYNYDGVEQAYYSPLMASYYDEVEKAYYVTNWGTQAHIPSLYKSEILYTTKYKEIGEGILEVTYVIQNFGDVTINHINAPWGGVRSSALRGKYLSSPDGSIAINYASTATAVGALAIDIDETGGYMLWASDTLNATAPSLGLVFGNEIKTNELSAHGLSNVYMRLAQVGGDTNPRDYTLFTLIPKLNVKKGETFYYRTYYINGTRDFVQAKSNILVPFVDYGFIEATPEETPVSTISATDFEQATSTDFELFTNPIENTVPIFLMENTATGKQYISPDLYYNVETVPLENPYEPTDAKFDLYENRILYRVHASDIKYIRLLGYGYTTNMSTDNSFVLLDDIILDESKFVITEAYKNKIWVKKSEITVTPGEAINLALNGTATQSTTLSGAAASRAIDDNTNGLFNSGSVTASQGPDAWWEVELDGSYNISDINIFNRTDTCCTSRLANFTVSVINSAGTTTFSQTITATPNLSVTIDAGGALGNTIRVQSNLTTTLNLAEVQVYGNVNLALDGTATQSTTLGGAAASRAIDNNTNGIFTSGSVTASQGPNPWWEVELDNNYSIDDINVYNRTDACCTSRLSDFTVSIINSSGATSFSQTITNEPNPSVTIDAGGAIGQVIRVQSNLTSTLNLAEVQVFGSNSSQQKSASKKETLSISNNTDIETKFLVYPNPVSDIITIDFKSSNTAKMQIIDYLGKTVISDEIQNGTKSIDLSHLSSGLYFIKVSDKQETFTRKIIKK